MTELNYEAAVNIINEVTKSTKFVAQENKTGTTWFEGKQRLVKVLKTKKDLKMEINLQLSKAAENKIQKGSAILQKITPEVAKQKHLGTMKYLYKNLNTDEVAYIVTDLLKNYNK